MTERDAGLLQRLLRILSRIEDGLLVGLLGMMIIMSAGQILLRNVFDSGFSNVEPFVRMLVLWVAMAGAIVASRQDKHINIDIASRFMPPSMKHRSGGNALPAEQQHSASPSTSDRISSLPPTTHQAP